MVASGWLIVDGRTKPRSPELVEGGASVCFPGFLILVYFCLALWLYSSRLLRSKDRWSR
jgi:hypothetical protein